MQIRVYGDRILRTKCLAVRKISAQEQRIFDEMLAKMREGGGVGLAASQVGLNKQMLVVDIGKGVLKLANPKIRKRSGSQAIEEGCLSVPGILVKVKRAKNILLEALNEYNQKISLIAEDILAIVLQHEIDHLRGKLIIDYLPWHKKIVAINKLKSKRARPEAKGKECTQQL